MSESGSAARPAGGAAGAGAGGGGLRLVRWPVERPQAAVAFLRLRSRGVMDLIAHFWEGLAQTAPLQRGDLHLVAAVEESINVDVNINACDAAGWRGAMLYVPKAHRADVLALDPATAGVLASYICHQGGGGNPEAGGINSAVVSTYAQPDGLPAGVEMGEAATVTVTDLSAGPRHGAGEQVVIPAEPGACRGNGAGNGGGGGGGGGSGVGGEAIGGSGANGGSGAGGAGAAGTNGGVGAGGSASGSGGNGGNGGGRVAIDFLTGAAEGIGWMTPLLLPVVHKRTPARQLINVVMQLPAEVACGPDGHVRLARESDVPVLNRWRRMYKEERGIHFDADMDALVQSQRVFVYELNEAAGEGGGGGSGGAEARTVGAAGAAGGSGGGGGGGNGTVVSVAKFDLELASLVEIGGVYTFPEYRQRGYGEALMGDMAQRIRQAGKVPTLQVDEANMPAMRLYEKAGWSVMGKLARVWLTG